MRQRRYRLPLLQIYWLRQGMLMLQIMGAVSEFERAMILERQREGIRIARAKGTYRGRKAALSVPRADELRKRAEAGEPKAGLARQFGITRQTLYSYLKSAGRLTPPVPPTVTS